MANVTVTLATVNFTDGFTATCLMTYNSPGNDANGEPIYTGAIVQAVCTNNSPTHSCGVEFKRNSGVAVFTRTLAPNTTVTYTGGGNIKNVEDIPKFSIWTL